MCNVFPAFPRGVVGCADLKLVRIGGGGGLGVEGGGGELGVEGDRGGIGVEGFGAGLGVETGGRRGRGRLTRCVILESLTCLP